MKKITILAFIFLSYQLGFSQELLTNESIIELTELEFGNEVIISKINNEDCEFDTSLNELKKLKSLNVSSEVLAAMIDKSKVEVDSGIFYFNNNDTLEEIHPSVFSGTKTNALGSAFSYGIAPAKMKSYIHEEASKNKVSQKNQTFVFRFDENKSNTLGESNWWFQSASSPNEFVLTKLKPKKGTRELVTGKVRGITATSQIGINTKDAIPFTIEESGKGIYKVTPKSELKEGEYCFFYQGAILGGFTNQSIFDFSIVK